MRSLDQPMPHNILRPDTRKHLIDRIQQLQPNAEGRWGKMNAHEMLVHCCDAARMATGHRPVPFRGNLLGRTVIKWGILLRGKFPNVSVRAPRAIRREGDGSDLGEFEADREQLIHLVESFPEMPFAIQKPTHNVFGPMSRREWGRLGYIHTDHHLRQFGV